MNLHPVGSHEMRGFLLRYAGVSVNKVFPLQHARCPGDSQPPVVGDLQRCPMLRLIV